MKALLLVGGLATRLRPLSLSRPKCLFPLQNKPIIDYILENLAKASCTDAVLAVNNLADKIESYLGHEKYGVKIHYSYEETPLGTGGPVKLASEHLGDDDFLVLNGDILSFIDYSELMHIHKRNQKTATITLTEVTDPTRYGVAQLDGDTIQRFIEKPSIDEAPSNWINAGCYALNPEIMENIPDGKCSLEREVFPKLAESGQLKAYRYRGDWIDIGVPEDYLRADKILRKRDSSTVTNAGIIDSIIWENTVIGENTEIIGSIIADNCKVGENVVIRDSVIADHVEIKDNIIINAAKIGPNKKIETSLTG